MTGNDKLFIDNTVIKYLDPLLRTNREFYDQQSQRNDSRMVRMKKETTCLSLRKFREEILIKINGMQPKITYIVQIREPYITVRCKQCIEGIEKDVPHSQQSTNSNSGKDKRTVDQHIFEARYIYKVISNDVNDKCYKIKFEH